MCGITGWVDFGRDLAAERETLTDMTRTLACRGPDAEGVWLSSHAALGHRRLAVIDLEGGAQPMLGILGPHDPCALTFAGEIYNFTELGQIRALEELRRADAHAPELPPERRRLLRVRREDAAEHGDDRALAGEGLRLERGGDGARARVGRREARREPLEDLGRRHEVHLRHVEVDHVIERRRRDLGLVARGRERARLAGAAVERAGVTALLLGAGAVAARVLAARAAAAVAGRAALARAEAGAVLQARLHARAAARARTRLLLARHAQRGGRRLRGGRRRRAARPAGPARGRRAARAAALGRRRAARGAADRQREEAPQDHRRARTETDHERPPRGAAPYAARHDVPHDTRSPRPNGAKRHGLASMGRSAPPSRRTYLAQEPWKRLRPPASTNDESEATASPSFAYWAASAA
jgi:hypothetical protein